MPGSPAQDQTHQHWPSRGRTCVVGPSVTDKRRTQIAQPLETSHYREFLIITDIDL
jgi:hypothetical protein